MGLSFGILWASLCSLGAIRARGPFIWADPSKVPRLRSETGLGRNPLPQLPAPTPTNPLPQTCEYIEREARFLGGGWVPQDSAGMRKTRQDTSKYPRPPADRPWSSLGTPFERPRWSVGLLEVSLGRPLASWGVLGASLRGLWAPLGSFRVSLRGPWGALWGPLGSLGGSLGVPGDSLGDPWGSLLGSFWRPWGSLGAIRARGP